MILSAEPIDLDVLRLRSEFLALPSLTVTVEQTARLLGVRTDHAAGILEALERERFLIRTATCSYRRAEPLPA